MTYEPSRRLAAILAADVVGYSSLVGADEGRALSLLKRCEATVIEPAVTAHGGRIFKRVGDGYLVEFASVVSAVRCAMAWQDGAEAPISFRMGVHLGDVVVDHGDLLGDGVNIAARLEAMADPGGVCLSEDAQRQLGGKLELRLDDLGPQRLKNIEAPIRVFRVAGLGAPQAPPRQGLGGRPRILLTPFRSRSGGAEGADLAEDVTEAVAQALYAFGAFDLIDPGQGAEAIAAGGVQDAARRLDATFVLEGSLKTGAGRVRVRVGLVDAATGRRLWSDAFDRDAAGDFAVEDDIAAMVGSTVGEAVEAELARAIADAPDDALTPYETFLRAISLLHRMNPADNRAAQALIEGLLERDEADDRAKLVLCWSYVIEISNAWPPTREGRLSRCFELIAGPLRTQDRSADVHRLMARLCGLAGDQVKERAHSERARALNPYDSDIMINHAYVEARSGRIAEAVALAERALSINPYAPPYYRVALSLLYYLAGRPAEGLACVELLEGPVGQARIGRILNLVALDRIEAAEAVAAELRADNPAFSVKAYLGGSLFANDVAKGRIAAALSQAGLPA